MIIYWLKNRLQYFLKGNIIIYEKTERRKLMGGSEEKSKKVGTVLAFAAVAAAVVMIVTANNENTSQTMGSGLSGYVSSGESKAENSSENSSEISSEISGGVTDGIKGGYVIRGNEASVEADVEMERLITEVICTEYEALARLEDTDITKFFEEPGCESALLNQTVLNYWVGMRGNSLNDLKFNEYEIGIKYDEINELEDGNIEVKITEDSRVRFAFLNGEDSYTSGMPQIFILKKTEKGYSLVSRERDEGAYILISEMYEEEKGDNAEEVFQKIEKVLLDASVTAAKNLKQQWEEYRQDPEKYSSPKIDWDVDYDASAAVEYANRWVGKVETLRNPEWGEYDEYGGNCNNFISQCLFAGGIPMDTKGTIGVQWKWYGEGVNERQTKKGRSYSWTGVGNFYQYCLHNTGYGLVAWTDGNYFAGQKGDIMQCGILDAWKHSVIITECVKDENGVTIDYLTASNTSDRINYPASAYAYPELRVIRIFGWNKK